MTRDVFLNKLDDFVMGKLNPNEMSQMEQLMQQDPALLSSFELEKAIQEGIQKERKIELKQRLNNIEISPATNYWGIVAGVSAFILTSLTIFWYTNNKDSNIAANNMNNEVLQNSEITINKDLKSNTVIENASEKQNINSDFVEKTTTTVNSTTTETVSSLNKVKQEEVNISDVVVPNTFEANAINDFDPNETKLPDAGSTINNEVQNNAIEIEVDGTQKELSYKYLDGKLFLYLDDAKKYYILEEVDKKGQRTVYLSYDKAYYELKNFTTQVTIPEKVEDIELIKKLDSKK